MKAPQHVVWSEGMLMSPQHLQAHDRYHESLLANRLRVLNPYDWGVLSLEIDPVALTAGQLRLARFSGIMPGGVVVSFEGGEVGVPPPRAVNEHLPPTARELAVYLAVPRARDGASCYADEGTAEAEKSRFLVSPQELVDATSPGSPVEVLFAQPNAVLLFGDEPSDDFDTIQIAEIIRNAAGQLVESGTYIPPCLRYGASSWLVGQIRELLARLVVKQRALAVRQQRNITAAELTAAEISRQLQLYAVSASVPGLKWIADAPDTSPQAAFLELTELAGRLAAFKDGADLSALPKFDFTDLRACFTGLVELLNELIDPIARDPVITIPLAVSREAGIPGLLVGRIEERVVRGAQLFLVVRGELTEAQVAQVPSSVKIGSSTNIRELIRTATPGVSLERTHLPPRDVIVRRGTFFFRLAQPDPNWPRIFADKSLAIYRPSPSAFDRVEIELIAVPLRDQGAGADRSA